jgi:hypothetical protein
MGLFCTFRVFGLNPPAPMFHVKHFCVKGFLSQAVQRRAMFHVKPFSSAPLTTRRCRDVSRETFLRKSPEFFLARH